MIPVKPLGHHVLVEILPVKSESRLGIILNSEKENERERKGRDVAKVIAFGPTAYKGFADCNTPEDWGVSLGDTVELKTRYVGKFSTVYEADKKHENLRYVADSDIIGVFSEDIVNQLMNEDK